MFILCLPYHFSTSLSFLLKNPSHGRQCKKFLQTWKMMICELDHRKSLGHVNLVFVPFLWASLPVWLFVWVTLGPWSQCLSSKWYFNTNIWWCPQSDICEADASSGLECAFWVNVFYNAFWHWSLWYLSTGKKRNALGNGWERTLQTIWRQSRNIKPQKFLYKEIPRGRIKEKSQVLFFLFWAGRGFVAVVFSCTLAV